MSTFTVTADQLTRIRPGDRVIGIDGEPTSTPITITAPIARLSGGGPMCLPGRIEGYSATVHIYPASHITESVTVDRPDPAPARRITRNIDGITLVSVGERQWRTDDGRYEITYAFGGFTECEEDHPVRITAALAAAAREAQGTSWTLPILAAIAAGRPGYTCRAGTEHAYSTWQVWDLHRNNYADDLSSCESFTDAARSLARHIDNGRHPS